MADLTTKFAGLRKHAPLVLPLLAVLACAPALGRERVVLTKDVAYATATEAYAKGDVWQAFEQYRLACNSGSGPGCFEAGRIAFGREVAAVAVEDGMALFATGCGLRHGGSCDMLGTAWRSGFTGPANPASATQYYDQACRAGFADGCNNLGKMREGLFGGTKDLKAARRAYQAACRLGDVKGCDMRDRLDGKR
jgi:TPR repeat protein